MLSKLVYPGPQVGGHHICLPTSDVLIQGIMEEHILVLREGEEDATPTYALAMPPFCAHNPHLCLHHEDTPLSHVLHKLVDVDGVLSHLETLHHGVQYYEGSRTPHPRTAVDQEGNPFALVMGLLYPPHEAEDGGGKLGYSMVRPGCVVVVSYLQRFSVRLCLLWGRARRGEGVKWEWPWEKSGGRGVVKW